MQKGHFHLQGRIADQAKELGLGCLLGGHQVENSNLQRADILGGRALLRHNKDVLFRQDFGCGQSVGNLNGHKVPPLT